jgi:hypothetical protein
MTFFGADLPWPLAIAAYIGALTLLALPAFVLWATVGVDVWERWRGRLPAVPWRRGVLAGARHRLGRGGGA